MPNVPIPNFTEWLPDFFTLLTLALSTSPALVAAACGVVGGSCYLVYKLTRGE